MRFFLLIVLVFVTGCLKNETLVEIENYCNMVEKKLELGKYSDKSYFLPYSDNESEIKWQTLTKADLEKEFYDEIHLYYESKNIILATIMHSSPSGDWAETTDYFYKENKLVRISKNLSTFYGNVKIVTDIYFNSEGKIIKKSVEYFDLESGKKINEPKELLESFKAEPDIFDTPNTILKYLGEVESK